MSDAWSLGWAPSLRPVALELLASLPLTLARPASPDDARLWLVDGRDVWTDEVRALLARRVPRIVVLDPSPCAPAALHDLAAQVDREAGEVRLVEPFAGNPALPLWQRALADRFATFASRAIDSLAPARIGFTQLRIARALGIAGLVVQDAQYGDGAMLVVASGTIAGRAAVVRMMATCSTAVDPRHVVDAYGAQALATLTLPAGDTARPAQATIVDDAGAWQLPTLYETAVRAELREPLSDAAPARRLSNFADDVAMLDRILGDAWRSRA